MLRWLEYEEQVGRLWHRLVGERASYPRHPGAAVALEAVAGPLAVFFRGLGGDPGVQIAGAGARASGHRLRLRQRIGLDAERLATAAIDDTHLRLPPVLDLFATPHLNRRLYFWLAAFSTQLDRRPVGAADPLRRDLLALRRACRTTRRTLAAFPGLRDDYRALCAALAAARPRRRLPPAEAAVEACVDALLGGPAPAHPFWPLVAGAKAPVLDGIAAPPRYRPFLPVPLWGEAAAAPAGAAPPDAEEDGPGGGDGRDDTARRRADRRNQDHADRDDPLILNNRERLLGVAEMVEVNRGDEEEGDADAARRTAEEMEEITLARHGRRPAVALRLDLDLAPEPPGGGGVTGGHLYPEWDFRRHAYRRDHCRVETRPAPECGEDWRPTPETRRLIRRVRRQFEALRPRRLRQCAQPDGDELDLEALVRARADLAAQGRGSERVHIARRRMARDLSVAFLVDVSLSTDAWLRNRRILDVEKEALTVLAHGLDACGDEHAIFAFTSRRRHLVRVETVKGFDEPPGPAVTRRINALRPRHYTRIGAALRHVTAQLADRPHRHRLLVALTDGKPNDIDHYQGRYGVEDTRRAVQEARRQGLAVFGVTVDRKAQEYFPRIFGRGSYAIVDSLDRLAPSLPRLYRQLVT